MANPPNLQPPPCGEEALALLNCVAASPYDPEKCITLLSVLRSCIESKNVIKFSLPKDGPAAGASAQQRTAS